MQSAHIVHPVATTLLGLGHVNRSFLHILKTKAERLRSQYGLAFRVVCVSDSSGITVNPVGFNPAQTRQFKLHGDKVSQLLGSLPGRSLVTVLADLPDNLVLEATPASHKGRPPLLPGASVGADDA